MTTIRKFLASGLHWLSDWPAIRAAADKIDAGGGGGPGPVR